MTQHRDLKRRIRDRMAKTGESYVTARQHVLAAREPDPPFDVIEPIDISDAAKALGLRCRASMFPRLAAVVDAERALARLRDALVTTATDPGLAILRGLVLRGELPPSARLEFRAIGPLRDYIRRVRAGIGGASPRGSMLALVVSDVMMICVAAATMQREPIVYLQTVDEAIGQRTLIGVPP